MVQPASKRLVTESNLAGYISSGPDVAATGDSLTAGAGDTGLGYPAALTTLLANYPTPGTVRNLGVGGETSATIAGRVGGRPYIATVSGGSIPASGGVTVTLAADDGTAVAPLLQDDVTGSRGTNPVDIAGVRGTLTVSGGVYTFTRTGTGTAVAAPRPVPVITDAQRNRRSDITIMWWGQNDGTTDATTIIARQHATVRELKVARSRYLVLGLSTGSDSTRTAMDAQFLAAHGRRFINIRKYLASTATLSDAGIVPTAQDNTDIAAGTVPTSFMYDTVHLNHAGYGRVARAILDRIQEFGWDDKWGTATATYVPTVYFSDNFNRADAANILTTATPVGAKPWTGSGTLTMPLTSNAAGMNITSAEGFAVANGGVTDGVLKATVRSPGDAVRPQLVARYVNVSNYLTIDGSTATPSKYRLKQKINATSTDLATNLGGLTPAAGDVIEWTLNGTATTIKINGTLVYSGTIPTIASGTYYGFYGFPSSQTNLWWDDIALTDIPPA